MQKISDNIPYTYKFSRNVIFEVWFSWSTGYPQNFCAQNFIDKTLACINQRARYLLILDNKITKMLDLQHPQNLHASKISMHMVYYPRSCSIVQQQFALLRSHDPLVMIYILCTVYLMVEKSDEFDEWMSKFSLPKFCT